MIGARDFSFFAQMMQELSFVAQMIQRLDELPLSPVLQGKDRGQVNQVNLFDDQDNNDLQATDAADHFVYDFNCTDNDMKEWGLERFEIAGFDPQSDKIIFVNATTDLNFIPSDMNSLDTQNYSGHASSELGHNEWTGVQELALVDGELIISHEVYSDDKRSPLTISRDGMSVRDEDGNGIDFGNFIQVTDDTQPIDIVGSVLIYDHNPFVNFG